MGLFRIFSSQDSFITNRMFSTSESLRATGSNFGNSPSLHLFKLTGSTPSSSVELARVLVQFDLTELSGKIYSDKSIPSSSVSYYMTMFDMQHEDRKPSNYDVFAYPLSRSWTEGSGIDNEKYRDFGPVNWLSASATATWIVAGSDYLDATDYGSGSQHIADPNSDFEINITDIVVNWLTGGLPNNGLVVKLGATEENHTTNSYYIKMLHSRETMFTDRMPFVEARWNNAKKDNRNNFAYNVENKMFMYNIQRGELTNVSETVTCRIQDHAVGASSSFTASFATHQIEPGILTASITVEFTGNVQFSASWYDIWESSTRVYMSGNFTPLILTGSTMDLNSEYVVDVTNLKRTYSLNEEVRLKASVRQRDYKTHKIVHTASFGWGGEYVEKMYYKIINETNGDVIVPYATGTLPYTQLGYDASGNYFDLSMNMFSPGTLYRLLFLIDVNKHTKQEVDGDFIFKVI